MNDAIDLVCRLRMSGRVTGLEASPLINRNVDQNGARPQEPEHLTGDKLGGTGTGDQNATDDHIRRANFLLDCVRGGIACPDAPFEQFIERSKPID